MPNQKGFSIIFILLGIVAIIVLTGGVYYLTTRGNPSIPKVNSSLYSPSPSQDAKKVEKISSNEMIIKGYAKDVQTKSIIPNPQATFRCELGLNKACESSTDGSFICKSEVKEGEHCGIYIGFKTSIPGKVEDTALAQYVTGQPGQVLNIGDMFIPLENTEDQKNVAQAFNLFESYLKSYVKEDWNQISNSGIDCGLDKTLVSKYGLRWFIHNSTGQKDGIYSYGVSIKDCENGCDIQKNRIFSYELYLQKNSQQWKCWNQSKNS